MSSSETFDTGIVDISEFFSGGDSSFNEEESEKKSTINEVDSPIKELKAIILSLDWEISDEIADSFITEVDRLSDVWQSDKSVVSFLSILRALGKYLRTHKADAHPDSIKLLYSVYNNFEKIVLTNEIPEEQEKNILIFIQSYLITRMMLKAWRELKILVDLGLIQQKLNQNT